MESNGVFCLVLLWTAVFTAGPGECNSPAYWNRDVKDVLLQDQKSIVTIQGWLDGLPEEFQKWFKRTNNHFQEWFEKTSPKFKKSFASSSKANRNWLAKTAKMKFFQWYSAYAEWFETYDVSCNRQKEPMRLHNTVNILTMQGGWHHNRMLYITIQLL